MLECPTSSDEDYRSVFREEVKSAFNALERGRPAEVDNIHAELVQAGGEIMIDVMTPVCTIKRNQ